MRRAIPMIVLGLVLATPAGAQQKGRLTAPPPAKAALRGPVSAAPGGERTAMPSSLFPPGPAPSSPTPQPIAADAGQCRLACARRYYFCLAGESPDDCPRAWGQCRAACDAPDPARPPEGAGFD